MIRRYQNRDDYDRKYTSEEFSCLDYYSKKMMKARYPEHGYLVVGAVGKGLKSKLQTFVLEEEEHDFYSLNYSKFLYGVDGYFDCGNNEVIAVVKSRLGKHLLLLLLCLLLIAGALFGGSMLLKDKGIGLDPGIEDFVPDIELPDNADPNRIAIPGYDEIRMAADTDEMYMALWNPETNPCYFRFRIILEEGDKLLYQSGLVPPGKAITAAKLSQKMPEGEYPIRIQMDTFSLEDGRTAMNSGTSKTVLRVIAE